MQRLPRILPPTISLRLPTSRALHFAPLNSDLYRTGIKRNSRCRRTGLPIPHRDIIQSGKSESRRMLALHGEIAMRHAGPLWMVSPAIDLDSLFINALRE